MSALTNFIKANRPSCVGLWDFGVLFSGALVLELISGLNAHRWDTSVGTWAQQQPLAGFQGQPLGATLSGVSAGATMAAGSPGADDYNGGLLGSGGGALTYEMLFQHASATAQQDLIRPTGNTGGVAMIADGTPLIYEGIVNYSTHVATSTVRPYTAPATMLATTYNNGAWVLYRNGVSIATGSNSSGAPSSQNLNLLNNQFGGELALGTLGMVAIYNKALSAAEILANYQAALGVLDPTLGTIQSIARGRFA